MLEAGFGNLPISPNTALLFFVQITKAADEEGPVGGPLFYDQIKILSSGKVSFLPRLELEIMTDKYVSGAAGGK